MSNNRFGRFDWEEYDREEYMDKIRKYKIFRPKGYEYEGSFGNVWRYKAKHGWFKKPKPDDEEIILLYDGKYYKSETDEEGKRIFKKDANNNNVEVAVSRSNEYIRLYGSEQKAGKKTTRARTKQSKKHTRSKKRRTLKPYL